MSIINSNTEQHNKKEKSGNKLTQNNSIVEITSKKRKIKADK